MNHQQKTTSCQIQAAGLVREGIAQSFIQIAPEGLEVINKDVYTPVTNFRQKHLAAIRQGS
jgi:hypothetical protein